LIVAARADDNNGDNSGSVRVFSGRDGVILYTFNGDSESDYFGAVGGADDVNGDGFSDFIVGAPADDDNGSSSGSVRVFSGRDGSILYTFYGDLANDQFGYSVSGAGDVNGDGKSDLIVGTFSSSAYVFVSTGSGIPDGAITKNKIADRAVTKNKIADGAITEDKIFNIHSLDAADGNPIDVVYVNSIGNVGIGTTNPSTMLEVAGAAYFEEGLSVGNSSWSSNHLNIDSDASFTGDLWVGSSSANDLVVRGDAIFDNRVNILPSGQLQVGSSAWSSNVLHVYENTI